MKKLQLVLAATLLSVGLISCGKGNLCVRCENGLLGDTVTECFVDADQREDFRDSRELLGYDCTNE